MAVVSQLHFGQMWSHFLVSVQTSLLERIAFRDPVARPKQPRLVHSESAAKVPGDVENLKILQVLLQCLRNHMGSQGGGSLAGLKQRVGDALVLAWELVTVE